MKLRGKRGVSTLKLSIAENIVKIWDYVAKVWHHIPYNEIRIAPEKHPTVCAQHMSETSNAPAMLVAIQADLSH